MHDASWTDKLCLLIIAELYIHVLCVTCIQLWLYVDSNPHRIQPPSFDYFSNSEFLQVIMIVITALKTLKNAPTNMWKSKNFSGVKPPNPHSGGGHPLPNPPPARPTAVRGRCATVRPLPKIRPPLYKILDPPLMRCDCGCEIVSGSEWRSWL